MCYLILKYIFMYILLYISAFFLHIDCTALLPKILYLSTTTHTWSELHRKAWTNQKPLMVQQLIKLKLHWLFIAMFDNSLVSLLTHAQTQTQHAGQEHCLYNICPPGSVTVSARPKYCSEKESGAPQLLDRSL